MAHPLHLAKRFFGSLRPGGPLAGEDAWARSSLSAAEQALWGSMPGADRRHAAGVARRVEQALPGAPPEVIAAALLHDVGKVDSGLGTFGRVLATLVAAVFGRDRAERWADSGGPGRRIGRYLRHPHIGAESLMAAGSAELTVAWAREHHLPADRWSIDAGVGQVLKAADDD